MLRYRTDENIVTKPVDYYRPLTVDVSVEYELPKEVAPPKGSAPLLIIHPSAYFRSKTFQKSNTSTNSTNLINSSTSHHSNQLNHSNNLNNSRLPPPAPQPPLPDLASTLFYLSTGGKEQTSSPSNAKNSKIYTTTQQNYSNSKNSRVYNEQNVSNNSKNHRALSGSSRGRPSPNGCPYGPECKCLETSRGHGVKKQGQEKEMYYASSSTHSVQNPTQFVMSANNKRLRTMSSSLTGNKNFGPCNEPLNLALAPPYLDGQNPLYVAPYNVNNLNYVKNGSENNKETPVPVNKSSGSDSGVCSENDSDVSPPFSAQGRRSSLLSHELPSAGCYCCCCPSTPSTSSRKSSSALSSKNSRLKNESSPLYASSAGNLNLDYGTLLNMTYSSGQNVLCNSTYDELMSNSNMDSTPLYLNQLHQQRKWFPQNNINSQIILDSINTSGRWFQV